MSDRPADPARPAAPLPAEQILESITDGFLAVGPDWRITYVNAAAARLYPEDRRWYIGKVFWDVFPAVDDGVFGPAYRRAMRDRTPVRAEGHYGAFDRWFDVNIYPTPDGGVAFYFRDVTDRTRAADELVRVTAASDQRKRLYETILSNTPDLAYVFDPDHRFVYANEVLLRMWGKTWDEAIGKTCLELGYEPWHAAMHDREIEQVKATKRPIRGEVPFTGTFGRRVYDYIFVPVLGPGGEVEAIAGTTRDVTERKQAEEERERLVNQLREQDRRKDEFLATLAHELRNPLAPIRNGLELLRMAGLAGPAADVRRMIDRQVGQLVHLVNDLLDVARVNTGKVVLRVELVDLRGLVEAAVETSRPLVEAAGHALEVRLPAEPIRLAGDRTRLAQVLTNLLNNAAKYTPPGGRIELAAERHDGHTTVSVTDTGIGIPGDMLPKVFDLFTQVGGGVDRAQGGLGIGLTLVRRLVEMHGGTVAATSSGPGQGSTFTVRLPLA